MERNITQSEYEAISARRVEAGKEPLTYRDANRQARRLTSRQRNAAVSSTGRGPQEASSEGPRARLSMLPPTPPRSRRQQANAEQAYGQGEDTWTDWSDQDWWWNWNSSGWRDWSWRENLDDQEPQDQEMQQDDANDVEIIAIEDPEQEDDPLAASEPAPEISSMEAASSSARDRPAPEVSSMEATSSSAGDRNKAASTGSRIIGGTTGFSDQDVTVDPISLFHPPLTEADLPDDTNVTERISRLLTACVRHKPQDFGLILDEDGFADLEDVAKLRAFRKYSVSPRKLAAVAAHIIKKRFIFQRKERQILVAASHGHSQGILRSLRIFQVLDEETAPEQAFHATQFRHWQSISSNGLWRMDREHIHMAYSEDQKSGVRQGQDILLVVQTRAVVASGILLLKSATGVLLTPGVTSGGLLPVHFISEARHRRTGKPHTILPKAGQIGSLQLESGLLPPMPIASQGGPAEWNDPELWSHVRSKIISGLPHSSISLHPARLLLSFLAARGLGTKVDDRVEPKVEAGEIWNGLRVLSEEGSGDDLDTFYHGTHLYAISSILWKGLSPSTSQAGTRTLHIRDTPLEGVYSFTNLKQGLFYCPYILLPLSASGMETTTVAVRVSLELTAEPHANRRRGKKTNQFILDENKVRVRRIWVQAKSPDSLQLGEAFTQWYSTLEAPV